MKMETRAIYPGEHSQAEGKSLRSDSPSPLLSQSPCTNRDHTQLRLKAAPLDCFTLSTDAPRPEVLDLKLNHSGLERATLFLHLRLAESPHLAYLPLSEDLQGRGDEDG